MNNSQHKFYTAAIAVVLLIVGIIIAAQFNQFAIGAFNIAMLLVNSLLLLIIIGLLLQQKAKVAKK